MAESVVVECPSCSARLKLADASKLGKKIRCPKCSEVFVSEPADEPEVQRLRPARAPSRTSSKKGKPSKRRSSNNSPTLLIGGGVALLLLIAGAGAWMLMGGDEVAPNPNGPGPAPLAGNNPPVTGTTPSVTPQTATSGETTAAVPLQVQTVAGVELEPRSVLGGRVRLLIPKSFGEMDDEVRNAKYPAAQRPTLVYTNDDGTINIAFNHTPTRMMANEFPAAIPQLEGTFRKLVQGEDWIGTTTPILSGTKWLSLDFRIKAVDMVIRNWMTMTSLENRLLIISVNAPQANEGTWNEVAKTIQQSIQLSGPTESPNPVPGIAQSNQGSNGPPTGTQRNQASPFKNPVPSSTTTPPGSGKPAVPQKTPEELERDAVLAAQALRSDNTNPAAYTKDGGRRSDDPEPVLLPDVARGNGEVNIQVNALWGAGWDWYVHKRVTEMVAPKQMRGQFRQGFMKLTFAGVSDLEALAKIIDFGTVTSIDPAARLIEVKADPARLPKPQRVIDSPREKVPGFVSSSFPEPEYSLDELLSGLTHWHPNSREAACIRLGVLKSLPEADLARVIEAVRLRESDQDFSVRLAAGRSVRLLEATTK